MTVGEVDAVLKLRDEMSATLAKAEANLSVFGSTLKDTDANASKLGSTLDGALQSSFGSAVASFVTAQAVVAGEIDLESLGTVSSEELSDDDLAKRLLVLPGVGPYAAAHIMMMIGRSSRPIFDSWTRPSYARIVGRETVPDTEILARFQSYGAYAGLAFWLFVTRDWIVD